MNSLLDIILPKRCLTCFQDAPGAARSHLCGPCESDLPLLQEIIAPPPFLDEVWAPFSYEGALKKVIQAYKFRGKDFLNQWLGERMAEAFPENLIKGAVLCPAPTNLTRYLRRGFNPAEELAIVLSRAWSIPILPALFYRRLFGPSQTALGKKSRWDNAIKTYGFRKGRFSPPEIILVDDVLTTGATLSACARAARERGARRVYGVVAAYEKPILPLH